MEFVLLRRPRNSIIPHQVGVHQILHCPTVLYVDTAAAQSGASVAWLPSVNDRRQCASCLLVSVTKCPVPQVCPPAQQRQPGSPAKEAQPKGGSPPKQHGAGPAAAASGGLSPKGPATAPWVKPQPAAAADKGARRYEIFPIW